MAEDLRARWTSTAWRDAAETWIHQTLRANAIRPTGAVQQPRVRFWSTQLTVPTDRGLFWFKENNPDQAFEAALVGAIAELAPDHVVVPLATDPARGWLLSADQGPTMYAANEASREVWVAMARDFAALQRRLAGHQVRLAETGLTMLEPTHVPAFVEDCLQRGRARPRADPRHIEANLEQRVRDVLPWLGEHGALLESGPIPLSLEHNDLHHNNTFVPRGEKPLRFFDFADSLWAHPFTSMCVPIEHMSDTWDVAPDSTDIAYVLDSYLECWSDLGSSTELRSLMQSALPFGQAHRLVSWERVLPYADDEGLAELGGAIPGWLSRLVSEVARTVDG